MGRPPMGGPWAPHGPSIPSAPLSQDALAADPYNLMQILELGKAYAVDEKWKEAANVLMRGWKRVDEFQEKPKEN